MSPGSSIASAIWAIPSLEPISGRTSRLRVKPYAEPALDPRRGRAAELLHPEVGRVAVVRRVEALGAQDLDHVVRGRYVRVSDPEAYDVNAVRFLLRDSPVHLGEQVRGYSLQPV